MKKLIRVLLTVSLLSVLFGCNTLTIVKTDDLNKLQTDNSNMTAENQGLQNDLKNQKDQVASLQDERDSLLNRLTKLSNDNAGLKNMVDSTKGKLGKQIDSLNSEIKNNDLKILALQDQISNKDSEIASLSKDISDVSAEKNKLMQAKELEISNLNMAQNNMAKAMEEEIKSGELKIKQLGDVLNIDFVDKIFFDSGSSDIKKNGKKVLDKMVAILKNIKDKQIRVEGYTDNVPIAESYMWKFPSNWELSTARATTIVRYFQSQGIDPSLLKATGYGEYNPFASNDTEEGRAQNRRIVILLVPLDERSKYK